ncbi:NAD-dependent epimerase/dehydratase family protein [Paenibacillus fonticola]|uniref:NAD-dependent epimerase/dehydratase family protein n=1 Tax=Paenibacillus fonticola TaxID=379896 RepID=UPI000368F262|nr:NAD(P)-dependent oxidoreductase [Paenibacillus fonticola]
MVNSSLIRVAILGATGHIGKNVTKSLCEKNDYLIFAFARSQDKLSLFLSENNMRNKVVVKEFNQFNNNTYDVVINCIGIVSSEEISQNPYNIFKVTEEFDNLVISYIQTSPNTKYINLSSGAIYGTDYSESASLNKKLILDINSLTIKDYYGISKLNMEAKHRSLADYNIVDLRIFSFFSRFIDRKSTFFLTDVLNCLEQKKVLKTSSEDMVRDYVHPEDLINLIELCIQKSSINYAYDVFSVKPVSKFELLDYFIQNHELKVEIKNIEKSVSITGLKSNYYTLNTSAIDIGYSPQYDSLQSVSYGFNLMKMGKFHA